MVGLPSVIRCARFPSGPLQGNSRTTLRSAISTPSSRSRPRTVRPVAGVLPEQRIRAYVYTRSRESVTTRILSPMDLDRSKPVWPQVAAELRRRLDAGTYAPGERFPAVVELATELDVAPSTVQKAVAALREEGRLYTVLGQGSFVSKP
ncbi:GntR family transcriptional regulator [Streptomyces sp. NPDC001982]|uniref:GntR family transcriptional regulator n=2 Tax=Streptomyces TaxID=1883 RepID=UPI003323F4E2